MENKITKDMAKTYDPKLFEDRIYENWEKNGAEETVYDYDAASEYYRAAAYGTCT